jgi:Uma2 family endonuclease
MIVANIPEATPVPGPEETVPLMTGEEFFALHGDRQAELVNGVLKELPMPSFKHGRVCAKIARLLDEFTERHNLGRVVTNDTSVRIRRNPDTVYGPDVLFVSFKRLPAGEEPEGMLEVIPDLVVEVRSPSNTWTEITAKVEDYLTVGVRAVLVLDPDSQSAFRYYKIDQPETIKDDEQLTIPEVLPGFIVQVSRLFS